MGDKRRAGHPDIRDQPTVRSSGRSIGPANASRRARSGYLARRLSSMASGLSGIHRHGRYCSRWLSGAFIG
ncbi:hypothetical protein PLICRDRAFT_593840 [Plicaturopsis crispa FD-325 SS-3]|nr:hypothetical protein PLICRDRAFT_593840 [Plicaturopsis crispa FD-325 SS-3]